VSATTTDGVLAVSIPRVETDGEAPTIEIADE
jgi:HSP20 family molecular chaperone IbpA